MLGLTVETKHCLQQFKKYKFCFIIFISFQRLIQKKKLFYLSKLEKSEVKEFQ